MPLYIAILFVVLPLIDAFPHTPPRLERSVPFEQSFNLTETSWFALDVETGRQVNVESVEILQGVNPLLDASLGSEVRAWKFQPAMRTGTAVIENVIVVASYLRPMINTHPPSTGGPYYPYVPGPNPGSPASSPSMLTMDGHGRLFDRKARHDLFV